MEQDPTLKPLQGRILLVTGAAEGIGHAVALAAAAQGATLVLCDHPDANLAAVYDSIETAGGAEPAILPLNFDTADDRACRGAADLVGGTFGRLDGLVHCAAFAPFLARLDDYDPDEWARVLRINLTTPFLLTQAVSAAAAGVRGRGGDLHLRPGRADRTCVLGRLCGGQIRH